MKLTGYTAITCLVLVGALECANAAPVRKSVYMTSQIQRLLNEKQEKMSKLEECDGKRKGFMIAGISTIGLTAVGVGINMAQASKSNKLSNQIEDQKRQLEKQQSTLADINSKISDKQNDQARRDCESDPKKIYVNGQCLDRERYECDQNPDKEWKDGRCVDKEKPQQPQNPQQPQDYSGYTLDCSHTQFEFISGTEYQTVLQRLNAQCKSETNNEMVETLHEKTPNGKIIYECKGYSALAKCNGGNGGGGSELRYDGIIGQPCSSTEPGLVWVAGGDKQCLPSEGASNTVPCSCKKPAEIPVEPVPDPKPEPKPEPIPDNLPDRIIGKSCKSVDLPAHAIAGIYSLNGGLQCLKAEGSTDVVNCQCSITQCDSLHGYELKNGRCQAQEKLTCDATKHLVCENSACAKCVCEDNYVNLLRDADDGCVKRDYLISEKCACQDGTKVCGLVEDPNGQFICQTAKGFGTRCKCESCPRNQIFNSKSGKCEEDPIEKAKRNSDITCCDTADVYSKYAGTWVFKGIAYANSKCQCIFDYKNENANNAKKLIDAWGKENGESKFTCSPTDHNGRRAPQRQQARQCYGADTNAFYEFIFKK